MIRQRRKGFSLIELLIVIAIILIITAIALPNLTKARMKVYEMAATKALQTLNTAQIQYLADYGRYATTLNELGPPPGNGPASESAANLIGEDLASGLKSGYVFTMVGTPAGYTVNADPQAYNVTGGRSFYTDHTNYIRQHQGEGSASQSDPLIK